ncbi:MAG: hypothetical protein HKO65_06365 [Gemmatimonadetes bacterium]|nr:hypothetical protein [Gemmatimonadota bacterium]
MVTTRAGMTDDTAGFEVPQSMTPQDLGDTLARLVWESFSDFIADGDAENLLGDLGLTHEDGIPAEAPAEEILIFLMWAHTRGLQLAFVGRSDRELVREGLDAFHSAIFHDMVDNGTPQAQVPLFEQRVSARYAEYYSAAGRSDPELGKAVARHLAGSRQSPDSLAAALTERAIAVANPLKDFLEEVELVH